jgi:protein-tyrosine phosphatase
MIDMHCHFLPAIDDGPDSLAVALDMARMAVADGIYYSVMTPHITPGQFDNRKNGIRAAFESFRDALKTADIPLRIGMGAEVRLDLEVVMMLGRGEVPYLGSVDGFDILLLELPHTYIPAGAVRFVERLLKQNIRPVIAHPERNREIIQDAAKLQPFIDMGCFLQLTAGSLTGDFGRGPRKRARQLLETNAFKVLATDAHNLGMRKPVLSKGLAAAAAIVGEREAENMVYRNPASIVFGRRLPAQRLDRQTLHKHGLVVSPSA